MEFSELGAVKPSKYCQTDLRAMKVGLVRRDPTLVGAPNKYELMGLCESEAIALWEE